MQDSRRKHHKVTVDLYVDTPTRLYYGLDTAFAAREVTRRLEALAGCPTSPLLAH